MIFNMVGGGAGGAGGGATLVVSSPANVSVTVSKDDKSYTKNSGSLGSTTFKGLATGTWTVTISGNGQTATRTIEITADYAITIAFFSASINITYPANSTCVVTNSNGQTVASDTNATSSTKTWTATVSATGTYTITATATDGSGKSKSQSVSITADGQSKTVTLSYELHLFESGVGLAEGYSVETTGYISMNVTTNKITLTHTADSTDGQAYFTPPIDCSSYSKLTVIATQTEVQDMYSETLIRLLTTPTAAQTAAAAASSKLNLTGATTVTIDLSSIEELLYLNVGCFRSTDCEITDILFT